MSEIHRICTADGARLACRRHEQRGAPPVLLIHGLAVNVDVWDAPPVDATGYSYRSLASLLRDAGYDVWLLNLRGHGAPHLHSEPPVGQRDWCVDHFLLYDVPAAVEYVIHATGRFPVVIGNSMGAMCLAAYLCGATRSRTDEGEQIIIDPHVASQRQGRAAGAILVEFPAALRWPRSFFDERGALRWGALLNEWGRADRDVNLPFESMSRMPWLEAALTATGEIRLDWLRSATAEADSRWPTALQQGYKGLREVSLKALGQLAARFRNVRDFHFETFTRCLLPALDHLKAGVLRQLAKSVRAGGFVSALGTPDCIYSEHYSHIALPVLTIVGGRDRIANADVTRAVFYENVSSGDKQLLRFEDMAHGEFEYSPAATQRVYPAIVEWLSARSRRAI